MTEKHRQRVLSYSEIETAMTCFAQWDFKYGGRLAGSTLRQKGHAPMLSDGSAWGAAVAAWHANSDGMLAEWHAYEALNASLDRDAEKAKEHGFPISTDQRVQTEFELAAMLEHYMATTDPLVGLRSLEREIVVPILARNGSKRASTRYRFMAKIDGAVLDPVVNGIRLAGEYVVEFKLRTRLTEPDLLLRQRQPPWYVWSADTAADRGQPVPRPVGIVIDERLKASPKEPALTEKGLKPSHKKEQLTTPEKYVDLCLSYGVPPKDEVIEYLRQRQWQQRFPITLREDELARVGVELTDAAKLIRDLDSGEITPIRNAKRPTCNGCRFRAICPEPEDAVLVDSMFERTVPKRLRTQTEEKEAVL
jgi:hypothetical protein